MGKLDRLMYSDLSWVSLKLKIQYEVKDFNLNPNYPINMKSCLLVNYPVGLSSWTYVDTLVYLFICLMLLDLILSVGWSSGNILKGNKGMLQ